MALVTGCGTAAAPTAPSTAPPTPTAKPTPTSTPTPTATPGIVWVEIQPEAAIDIPGVGYIPAFSDGTAVWVVAKDELLKIDPKTNDVVSLDAPVTPDDTTLALADDGLWVARWGGGKLYRLDPQTAKIQLESTLDTPVNIQFVGEDMWIGQESKHSMFKVDRSTGEIDPTSQLDGSAYAASGMGDFWSVNGVRVTRTDPTTKEVKATIDLTGKANCASGIGGEFPDAVWTGCFERDVREHSLARIDPMTNTVAAVVKVPPSHGGGFTTIGDHTWYLGTFEDANHNWFAGFVRIDLQTGVMDRFYSIPGVDPDGSVSVGDALWIPDERGHRLVKIDPADLDE